MKRLRSLISRPHRLLTVLAALLPIGHSMAAEKATKLPLSIYCFDYTGDIKSVSVRTSKAEVSSIILSTANVIDAGEVLAENGVITLYGPSTEEMPPPVAATLQIGTIRHPLAILVPAIAAEAEVVAEESSDRPAYQSHVIDADEKSFSMGSYHFVNLSPFPVRIIYGDHTMEFKPDSDKLFNPKVEAGELLAVSIEYQVKDAWLPVSSSRWAYRKDRRTLVCVHHNAQTQRMLLKSIPLRE